jgi:hypothetical protein
MSRGIDGNSAEGTTSDHMNAATTDFFQRAATSSDSTASSQIVEQPSKQFMRWELRLKCIV